RCLFFHCTRKRIEDASDDRELRGKMNKLVQIHNFGSLRFFTIVPDADDAGIVPTQLGVLVRTDAKKEISARMYFLWGNDAVSPTGL
ncbi:MAG: hypothetical protein AAFR67_14525, partial [Chloroflexota bacterium]